jgi:5'-nucleotidase
MLILVSNDDGIYSHGIKTLAEKLKKFARVVVVAPDREQSASSHSITLHRPLRVNQIQKNYYSVSGTPTDCITLGVNEILKKKPDLIVSGINRGANLGDDVHYSGTVSAAMEGVIMGIPSMAISLVTRSESPRYTAAANFACKVAKRVVKNGLPKGVMLNINVPDLPREKIKGHLICILGKRNYSDVIVEKIDPRGKKYYWIGGDEVGADNIPGSDCNAVAARYISITPLNVNLTEFPFLDNLRNWKI